MKKKSDPKPKKPNGVKGAKFVRLQLEPKQALKTKTKIKANISSGTRGFKSVQEQKQVKKRFPNAARMYNNPYDEPLRGRIGVSDKVADAHSAVSKFNKKKK